MKSYRYICEWVWNVMNSHTLPPTDAKQSLALPCWMEASRFFYLVARTSWVLLAGLLLVVWGVLALAFLELLCFHLHAEWVHRPDGCCPRRRRDLCACSVSPVGRGELLSTSPLVLCLSSGGLDERVRHLHGAAVGPFPSARTFLVCSSCW